MCFSANKSGISFKWKQTIEVSSLIIEETAEITGNPENCSSLRNNLKAIIVKEIRGKIR